MTPFTLVSAADTSHARSLLQLYRSFRRHHPQNGFLAVDLGMNDVDTNDLFAETADDEWFEYLAFPYEDYPAYFDVNVAAGEYAWKPVIIDTVMQHVEGVVVWADAGCRIDGPLDKLVWFALDFGLYASLTCGSLQGWTDPRTLDLMNVPQGLRKKAMRAATLLAFDPKNIDAKLLVSRWAEYAMIKDVIAPEGSSKRTYEYDGHKQNHRQDQSVLTALLALGGYHDVLPAEQCRWNWTAHCDCDGRARNV